MVEPGSSVRLAQLDPADRLGLRDRPHGQEQLEQLIGELGLLHNRLWAESERSLLLVLQGLDASGKDGSIRSVLTGVNPQGTRIVSFKEPDAGELAHDYLWRVHALCPARGELGIFHISRDEQRDRLRARLADPEKTWKFRRSDLEDRARWDAFASAYEDVIAETSTAWAPWHVVPADHKWVRNVAVATLLVEALRGMDPRLPAPEPGVEDLQVD